jgi:NAD(P)H-hydrate epimerase
VIDGILGTGFRTPLSNYLFDMINLVNDQADKIVSIDIASGIESTSGEASGTAIKANVTLAVGLPKTGNYQAEGPLYSGIIHSLNAGFPSELLKGGDKFLLSPETVAGNYAPRSKFAHKNTFGHSLVVGGSKGLSGALIMASQSALKVGTGLVTASTWAANYDELCARISSEIMTGNIPRDEESVEEIIKNFKRYDSIVIGPGLGRSSESRDVVLKVLNNFHGPVVVDADAIRVLSLKEDQKVLRDRKAPTILTPHIGEFAHFCGQEIDVVLRSPMTFLKELVDETQCSIVMKGACTYLGFPNGELYVNYFPNDGMASGGSGDVLAGILGGLLAQVPVDTNVSKIFFDKKEYFEAVCLGVVAHTLAGKHAVRSLGSRAMTAGSITEFLSPAFRELDKML